MSYIKEFENMPEVDFTDGWTLDKIQSKLEEEYGKSMQSLGKSGVLSSADPYKLLLMSVSAISYQIIQLLNLKGKMNFLRYATGEYLDHLASFKKITRLASKKASATVRFTMTSVRTSVTPIPAGTRVSTENGIFFEVESYDEIPIGDISKDVKVTAITAGADGNDIAIGLINQIVDPLPYIASIVNTTASSGGTDTESDDDLTYRIYMAPAGYSVAGPRDAYEYLTRAYSADIEDVEVTSPEPCYVTVKIVLADGEQASDEFVAELQDYLSEDTRRPLADRVTVAGAEEEQYNIQFTYYIDKSKSAQATEIQKAVNTAVSEYVSWQRKMGRDINPTELTGRLRNAGIKRVELVNPIFKVVEEGHLPIVSTTSITYGGLEDD